MFEVDRERFRERHWPALVLGACAMLMTTTLTVGSNPHQQGPRLILLAELVCGPIFLLRRWPIRVAAAAATFSGLFVAVSGQASLPFTVATGCALYFAASRLPRRQSIWLGSVIAAALGIGMVYGLLTAGATSPVIDAVEGFLPMAAGWFAGDGAAARRRYLEAQARQTERERVAEVERARQEVRAQRIGIARELHDVVAHTLAVITVQAGVGKRMADRRPQEATAALESIETIGRTAQDELRVVLGLLRDEEAWSAPLAPTPRLVDLKELADTIRASGVAVDLRLPDTDRRLSVALELSLYRVVQEALTNVVKHAPGAAATVSIAVSAKVIRLEVTDDGSAAAPEPARTGHGIAGMRERIGAFGGQLTAGPLPGRGFRVLATVPCDGPS